MPHCLVHRSWTLKGVIQLAMKKERRPPHKYHLQSNRHWFAKAKAVLIELTAFVSLLLVLIKIIVTELHSLLR
jgi:hypothetical protein